MLLGAAPGGDGLALTARGNLARGGGSAVREAMDGTACPYEGPRRVGKVLSEGHVGQLHLGSRNRDRNHWNTQNCAGGAQICVFLPQLRGTPGDRRLYSTSSTV